MLVIAVLAIALVNVVVEVVVIARLIIGRRSASSGDKKYRFLISRDQRSVGEKVEVCGRPSCLQGMRVSRTSAAQNTQASPEFLTLPQVIPTSIPIPIPIPI